MEEEFCKTVPRETCDPERVLPKQETKPLVKKVCVEESQDTSEDDDDNNDVGDEGTTFPPSSGTVSQNQFHQFVINDFLFAISQILVLFHIFRHTFYISRTLRIFLKETMPVVKTQTMLDFLQI